MFSNDECIYDVALHIDEDISTLTITTSADEETHQYNKLFIFSEERQSEDTTGTYSFIPLHTGQQWIKDDSSIPDNKVPIDEDTTDAYSN